MNRYSLTAFVLSNALDIVLTLVAAVALLLLLQLGASHGLTHAQRHANFLAIVHSTTFRVASVLISIVISTIAGFIGGTLADRNRTLHGLLSVSLLFLYSVWQLRHRQPGNLGLQLAFLVILPAFSLLGGRVAELESSNRQEEPILPAPPHSRR